MGDLSTTSRSRELGRELRRVREHAGYQANELAMKLRWSSSKICRIELGRIDGSVKDIVRYLGHCGVVDEDLNGILDLVDESDNGYRLRTYTDGVPDSQRSLVVEESVATRIQEFDPIFIPGLIQTREYAEALFREAGTVSEAEIGYWVQVRMDRQELLKKPDPPQCEFHVHENVLRDPVGSPQVMHEQLLWLLFLDSRPYCDIRVVPRSGGRGQAMNNFRIMEYVDNGPVVYVETETASLFLENRADLDFYRGKLGRIDHVALDKARSREFLERLADDHDRAGEGDGGQGRPAGGDLLA
jgi:transcriptional regulator with XRE-family HTH domain